MAPSMSTVPGSTAVIPYFRGICSSSRPGGISGVSVARDSFVASWSIRRGYRAAGRLRRQLHGALVASSATGGSQRSESAVDSALGFEGDSSFGFEDEAVGESVSPAPPPTAGRIQIVVDKEAIRRLDMSAAHAVLRKYVHQLGDNATPPASDPRELFGRTVGFVLNYEPDDPFDPRELSEMPDIRLWFVRLDVDYPWLPMVLDWRAGELARYAAMLVPHQMSRRMGVVYNPEALELFVMRKLFLLHTWMRVIGIKDPKAKLNDMLKMLGFCVTDELYLLIEQSLPQPPPEGWL